MLCCTQGWEVRSDILTGRQYYIDHVNKTTSWTLPVHIAEAPLSKPQEAEGSPVPDQEAPASVPQGGVEAWDMLSSSVEVFRRTVIPEALTHMAEVFLMNGDRNAFLYTGSQAMHSDKLLIFEVSHIYFILFCFIFFPIIFPLPLLPVFADVVCFSYYWFAV